MLRKLWRSAHLALAILSSVFLAILALTGIILAGNAVYELQPDFRVENFDSLNLQQVVPGLQEVYPEIISLSVDHRGFVSIDALDAEGNAVKGYIDPNTGEKLGDIQHPSSFIAWTTALHRSLFLKETGRTLVAIVSFLLILISVSGLALILQRQQGFRNLFKKMTKDDFFLRYLHALTGRWALLPILFIAITGTVLFLTRLPQFQEDSLPELPEVDLEMEALSLPTAEFPAFAQIPLQEVEQLDFPFIPDDPSEFFFIRLKDRSLYVSQISGKVLGEMPKSSAAIWEAWNWDQHTGRRHAWLALVLGLASVNILVFIYSGFAITLRRTRTKVRNKYTAQNAEIVLLYGSEGGNTLFLAHKVQQQLLQDGQRVYLGSLNDYTSYPQARQLIVLTSTYGLGDPPANAARFEAALQQHPQDHPITYTVVGFGSKAYADYCAYAKRVDGLLAQQAWASSYLPLHLVNDGSPEDWLSWVHAYSEKSLFALATAASAYQAKAPKMQRFKVIEKTDVNPGNPTFKVVLEPLQKLKYASGDLLAIYPAGDHRERLYSVGRCCGKLQLIVKLHEQGLGSGYLHQLQLGQQLQARLLQNKAFQLPKQAPAVILIANGTGIAPFLGMIDENQKAKPLYLYAGFRHNDAWIAQYRKTLNVQQLAGKLADFRFAFSREEDKKYVMDLILQDGKQLAALLEAGAVLMICGSLRMLRDVELVLEKITQQYNGQPLSFYQQRGQILTDCY